MGQAHLATINHYNTEKQGAGIHVGIIDSLKDPGPGAFPSVEISNTRSVLGIEDLDPNPHGWKVLGCACNTANDAKFSLYQAAENAHLNPMDYGRAVELAIDDGVDILNVSYGHLNKNCTGDCGLCYVTEQALEADVIVVAAAGNQTKEQPSIRCPAIKKDVIAAAGVVSLCNKEADRIPRGAYKLPNPDEKWTIPDNWQCGQRGCEDGINGTCIEHLTELPWKGNPTASGDKPDILAPVHIIANGSKDVQTDSGTSYAAPMVAAGIAIACGALQRNDRRLPNPYQARQAVRDSGLTIRAKTPKLDVAKLTDILHRRMETRQ